MNAQNGDGIPGVGASWRFRRALILTTSRTTTRALSCCKCQRVGFMCFVEVFFGRGRVALGTRPRPSRSA